MFSRWMSYAGAAAVAAGAMAGASPSMAGPSMSSAWLSMTISQEECVRRGAAAARNARFTTRLETLGNSSIYGERGDYTLLVRCVADKGMVYFVVAGPTGDMCSRYMNQVRDDF